jgi:hypothetical protein
MPNMIKPYEAYGKAPDGQIVTIGSAIVTALTGNSNFPNLPVDLAVLKTDIDTLSALIVEAQDGSKKVIAEKNRQRDVVVKKLRLLGRYPQHRSRRQRWANRRSAQGCSSSRELRTALCHLCARSLNGRGSAPAT